MLKVAVATIGAEVQSNIPPLFEEATHLLIMDAETDQLLFVAQGADLEPEDRSIFFVSHVVEYDCEALLCGLLEPEPFAVLAEENCVTRYNGAGFSALDAISRMNHNALELITDFIGGTGCPEPDPANCDHDHFDEEDD